MPGPNTNNNYPLPTQGEPGSNLGKSSFLKDLGKASRLVEPAANKESTKKPKKSGS